ncbi:MAG: DUF2630 family protein [Actinomycetota bacterium]
MQDPGVLGRINDLAHEEEDLYAKAGHGELGNADRERLRVIQIELDQCSDLLHQRRARRSGGLYPEDAKVRPPEVVEGYEA